MKDDEPSLIRSSNTYHVVYKTTGCVAATRSRSLYFTMCHFSNVEREVYSQARCGVAYLRNHLSNYIFPLGSAKGYIGEKKQIY